MPSLPGKGARKRKGGESVSSLSIKITFPCCIFRPTPVLVVSHLPLHCLLMGAVEGRIKIFAPAPPVSPLPLFGEPFFFFLGSTKDLFFWSSFLCPPTMSFRWSDCTKLGVSECGSASLERVLDLEPVS